MELDDTGYGWCRVAEDLDYKKPSFERWSVAEAKSG